MRLTVQKRIAASILKCSPSRVWVDPERLQDVKEAITKQDIRSLVNNGLIVKKQKEGQSHSRIRKNADQRRKGRQKGQGSRKGKATAREEPKITWVHNVRIQRTFARVLKNKNLVSKEDYKMLMGRIKGGFFRSKRHIKIFITERGMVKGSVENESKSTKI